MFKTLVDFLKGKDFINSVINDFAKMLDNAELTYTMVHRKLIHKEGEENLEQKVYNIDKQINESERDIRKKILQHLAIQPAVDLSTSLLLMSVVKDAERLGDFNKNLFEVDSLLQKPIDDETYRNYFNGIDKKIFELFSLSKKAFIDSDEDLANQTWKLKKEVSEKCDSTIEKLAKSTLSVNEAVCYTLLARYFKRISSHLTNIATSVVVPISDLDYYDEQLR